MGFEPGIAELVDKVKIASANLADGDARTTKRLAEL
jgi:hypothetical protein